MLPGKEYQGEDFARIAWRGRWLILASVAVALYIALIVSSRLEDMYQSEMLIQVVPQRVPDSYVRSTVTMRTEDRINALSQQVMSRTAIEGLIRQMDLYEGERAKMPMQDVVDLMRSKISVDLVSTNNVRDTGAFYVRFTYADPELATRVTEKLGGLFIALNARDRGELAETTDTFLQTQLAEARRHLKEEERKVEQFRQRNAGRLPSQLDSNLQAIQGTQMAIQAQVESIARDRDRKSLLERLYNDAQAELNAPPPLPTAGADPAAPGLTTSQQLAAAKQQLERLEMRYKPGHPDIGRTKRLISELEAKLASEPPVPSADTPAAQDQNAKRIRAREMKFELEGLDKQIATKEKEEQRLRDQLASYQRRVEEIPGVETEWTALTRDYDTQQSAYKEMLMKSEDSKVAVQLERGQVGEQFRILDPARPPLRPTGLSRFQVNALGALIGLALGIAWIALREFRDSSFHSSADVQTTLQLPVLALVPYVMNTLDRQRDRRMRLFATAAVGVVVVAGGLGFWALQLWKFVK